MRMYSERTRFLYSLKDGDLEAVEDREDDILTIIQDPETIVLGIILNVNSNYAESRAE